MAVAALLECSLGVLQENAAERFADRHGADESVQFGVLVGFLIHGILSQDVRFRKELWVYNTIEQDTNRDTNIQ